MFMGVGESRSIQTHHGTSMEMGRVAGERISDERVKARESKNDSLAKLRGSFSTFSLRLCRLSTSSSDYPQDNLNYFTLFEPAKRR